MDGMGIESENILFVIKLLIVATPWEVWRVVYAEEIGRSDFSK